MVLKLLRTKSITLYFKIRKYSLATIDLRYFPFILFKNYIYRDFTSFIFTKKVYLFVQVSLLRLKLFRIKHVSRFLSRTLTEKYCVVRLFLNVDKHKQANCFLLTNFDNVSKMFVNFIEDN